MSFVSPHESVRSSAPCDAFGFHCTEMLRVISLSPSTHPSLPAIPAAARGLAAHPQNMDSTGREDKGAFISRCEWKLNKNTTYLYSLATRSPLPTRAVWDLSYKPLISTGTPEETPYLEPFVLTGLYLITTVNRSVPVSLSVEYNSLSGSRQHTHFALLNTLTCGF